MFTRATGCHDRQACHLCGPWLLLTTLTTLSTEECQTTWLMGYYRSSYLISIQCDILPIGWWVGTTMVVSNGFKRSALHTSRMSRVHINHHIQFTIVKTMNPPAKPLRKQHCSSTAQDPWYDAQYVIPLAVGGCCSWPGAVIYFGEWTSFGIHPQAWIIKWLVHRKLS